MQLLHLPLHLNNRLLIMVLSGGSHMLGLSVSFAFKVKLLAKGCQFHLCCSFCRFHLHHAPPLHYNCPLGCMQKGNEGSPYRCDASEMQASSAQLRGTQLPFVMLCLITNTYVNIKTYVQDGCYNDSNKSRSVYTTRMMYMHQTLLISAVKLQNVSSKLWPV